MPDEFWLITYVNNLVWNRAILAFVPMSNLKTTQVEVMRDYWFLDGSEAWAQIIELRSMGVIADVDCYKSPKV